ncbi:hypothetical protein MRO53_00995, partial [Escherichia coli]|nr:hypothetical protein [Escherichia coli]
MIDLASVSKKDVNEVSLGAPVPEGRETINASISQCGQNGQYTLTFSGMPVSNYPNAIASSGEAEGGNDSNLLIVFYVQIMPDDFVMQLHR